MKLLLAELTIDMNPIMSKNYQVYILDNKIKHYIEHYDSTLGVGETIPDP